MSPVGVSTYDVCMTQDQRSLRLGAVSYLNTIPLISGLERIPGVEIVADVPQAGFMTFVGGFYARDPQDPANGASCERAVGVHAAVYNDYSIGFRCCRDAQ